MHHHDFLKVRNLLRRHVERRLVARNGGWRELRTGSALAMEIRRCLKERAIRRAAEQKIGRLNA